MYNRSMIFSSGLSGYVERRGAITPAVERFPMWQIDEAYNSAIHRAFDFVHAPIWEYNDVEHYHDRLNCCSHGEDNLQLVALHIAAFGLPTGVLTGRGTLSDYFSAVILHDVGKMDMPDVSIWSRPKSRLSAREIAMINAHPNRAAAIFSRYEQAFGITLPPIYREVAQNHHEKCNGNGSPAGLKAPDISYVVQLSTFADQINGRRENRPYQHIKYSLRAAFYEVCKGAGTEYSWELIEQFLQLFTSNIQEHVPGYGWLGRW